MKTAAWGRAGAFDSGKAMELLAEAGSLRPLEVGSGSGAGPQIGQRTDGTQLRREIHDLSENADV